MKSGLVFALLFVALCALVQCGNPDCQRLECAKEKAEAALRVLSDGRTRARTVTSKPSRTRTTRAPHTTTRRPTTAAPTIIAPKLASSYKDLPEKWDGILGPHNISRTEGHNYTWRGIPSRSCQIDCMSTVADCGDRNGTMKNVFTNCKSQYYNYGTEARLGCFSAEAIMDTQAQIVFDVCQRYNKCNVSFTPPDLVRTLRKAKGKNSKGSKIMTQAVTQWGKAAFFAARSGDPAIFEQKSAAAVAAVVDQAKQAASDAIARGEPPGPAVQKVIDDAARSFAEAATSTAQKVAIRHAAYAAYMKALEAKKQADEAKRQAKLTYANSYLYNREGSTIYSYSNRGYVRVQIKLTEREKALGREFAKNVMEAASYADKHDKANTTESKRKAEKILKSKGIHKQK